MKHMKVAGVRVFRTPNHPKSLVSVGIRVASRLNGTVDGLMGTYRGDKPWDGRFIGFITAGHFGHATLEGEAQKNDKADIDAAFAEADKFAKTLEQKYPRAKVMDAKVWKWGEPIEDAGEGVMETVFIDSDGDEEVQDTTVLKEALKEPTT